MQLILYPHAADIVCEPTYDVGRLRVLTRLAVTDADGEHIIGLLLTDEELEGLSNEVTAALLNIEEGTWHPER